MFFLFPLLSGKYVHTYLDPNIPFDKYSIAGNIYYVRKRKGGETVQTKSSVIAFTTKCSCAAKGPFGSYKLYC